MSYLLGKVQKVLKKNIKIFFNRPLIYWTIKNAKNSKYLEKIIVSTDDLEIANISEDNVSGISHALHAIEFYEDYDWLLLFKSTSPLRLTSDIDKSI